MTDTTIIDDIDRRITEFETFVVEAHQHPLPEYNVDWKGDLHPWFAELRDVEAGIWQVLVEQVRPALTEARAAGRDEAPFHQQYKTLVGLVTHLESLIERCRRRAPWMAAERPEMEQETP